MKRLTLFFLAGMVLAVFGACGSGPTNGWQETDMMKHGLPVKMIVPPDVEVTKSSLGNQQDFMVDGGQDYYVQVLMSGGVTGSVSNIVADLRESIESNTVFHEFTHEQEDGFIYEFRLSPELSNFGFRRVRIQGDNEFIFQNGMSKIFTKEQARAMFDAVIP